MKNKLKLLVGLGALAATLFMAATSSYGCWLWTTHQRECPKSLILKD
jgi:cyclic lactone autoinducer peptide